MGHAPHIYWADRDGGAIGRADLDGSAVDRRFIVDLHGVSGVAVDRRVGPFRHASTTVVSCLPAAVSAEHSTSCTATVTDPDPQPVPPTGTVGWESLYAGKFSPAASCTVAAVGADNSSCSVSYAPATTGSDAIGAAYRGDLFHHPSNAVATVTVGASQHGGPRPPSTSALEYLPAAGTFLARFERFRTR